MTVSIIIMRHSMTDIVVCDSDSTSDSDTYTEMTRIILHNIYVVSNTSYIIYHPHIESLQYSQSDLLPYMIRWTPLIDT